MEYTRIYRDINGDTHFEKCPALMPNRTGMGHISESLGSATAIYFQKNDPHFDWDFHQAPQKLFIIILGGVIEIEVSDGEVMKFTTGDTLLLEDDSGKGHRVKTFDISISSIVLALA